MRRISAPRSAALFVKRPEQDRDSSVSKRYTPSSHPRLCEEHQGQALEDHGIGRCLRPNLSTMSANPSTFSRQRLSDGPVCPGSVDRLLNVDDRRRNDSGGQ